MKQDPPTPGEEEQAKSQTKIQPTPSDPPETISIEVTYRTETRAFPIVEVQNPLRDPVQKFCKTFTHNIKQFQLRRGDDDLPFDDWERLYPNLSADLNRVKEGS